MPNFNLHWLVAGEALTAAPAWIRAGSRTYLSVAMQFSQKVSDKMDTLTKIDDAKNFGSFVIEQAAEFKKELQQRPNYDDITCFSAYMLGACGPDFWMLPSGGLIIPNFGEHHFDLGHYNRTHQQFFVSVDRLKGKSAADKLQGTGKGVLTVKAEMAYFLGMATHVAADLIIHQLVNVSAGAYNLLEKCWENENGSLPKNIWSTHNKVEHFWDSYVRLRYLGNHGPVFLDGQTPVDVEDWVSPMKLPVIEKLQSAVKSTLDAKVAAALRKQLNEDSTRFALEKPLVLPQVFADRLIAGEVDPFVYEVVVEKKKGAYPTDVVPASVAEEAESSQMKRGGKHTEANKAEFFSSGANTGTGSCSHNYITYIVCPDLQQVRSFGRDVFYHLNALRPFIARAADQARAFVSELMSAYEAGSTNGLKNIRHFWNLDTGLGLRVRKVPSATAKEVITRLDFVHVGDADVGGVAQAIDYTRTNPDPHIGKKNKEQWAFEDKHAFQTAPTKCFSALKDVEEPEDKYLECIDFGGGALAPEPQVKIDDDQFFPQEKTFRQKVSSVFSGEKKNEVLIAEIAHRLNLEVRVAISGLGGKEVGMFFYGSKAGVQAPWAKAAKAWLEEPAQILDHAKEGKDGPADLRVFTTRLLANLEPRKDLKRKVKAGEWNNVIPYEENKKYYGRNFAICTGRKRVLHPTGTGDFDGANHFAYYDDNSPTEQIFFTLHPLVRTPEGVFDVFTKEKVGKSAMTELRRIQAIGFMKIVLFYELGPGGACQLAECYVDGLRVPVEPLL